MTRSEAEPKAERGLGRSWRVLRKHLANASRTGRVLTIVAIACGALATTLYREVVLLGERARLRDEAERRRIERLASMSAYQSRRAAMAETIAMELERTFAREGEQAEETRRERDGHRDAAELILAASEKYPIVDPLLLASVGIVDTKLTRRARWQATGVLHHPPEEAAKEYTERLGLEYEKALLDDSSLSAELAARHLGELQRHYNDLEMVLAEYNGGPLDAGYLRARVGRLSPATRRFVPEVIETLRRLSASVEGGEDDEETAVEREADPGRRAAPLHAARGRDATASTTVGAPMQTDYSEEEQPRKESVR